jgi:hypothetical protein
MPIGPFHHTKPTDHPQESEAHKHGGFASAKSGRSDRSRSNFPSAFLLSRIILGHSKGAVHESNGWSTGFGTRLGIKLY